MTLNHSFSIEHAQDYGIECAILIHHMQFWIGQNQRMGRNFNDGRTWMYQTQKEIAAIYPYWSESMIQRFIKKLIDFGVIIKGNYNQTPFDRTVWYAFKNEEKFTILRNRIMEDTETHNEIMQNRIMRSCDSEECIDTDIKTDTQQMSVVGEDPPSVVVESPRAPNSKDKITKDDVYFQANRLNMNWSSDEIETAWFAFTQSKEPVTDPMKYIQGIIKKKRILRSKENKCQNQPSQMKNQQQAPTVTISLPQSEPLENIKEETSGSVTSGQLLAHFGSRFLSGKVCRVT